MTRHRLLSEPTPRLLNCYTGTSSEVVWSFWFHRTLFKVDGMQPTGQPHVDMTEKRLIQEEFAVFSTATRSFSRREEVVPVHDHGPLIPRRRRPRFLTRSTLIFASIVFSLFFIFPRFLLLSWPYSSLMPCLSGATSDHDETAFSKPISPTFSSNGRTDQVQWDNYTLVLQGQRVMI